MSTVNWSEVCHRWIAHGIDVTDLQADIEALGLRILPFTVADAEQTAEFWQTTRHLGLSLGGRACLGLASRLRRPALTADRAWLGSDLGVDPPDPPRSERRSRRPRLPFGATLDGEMLLLLGRFHSLPRHVQMLWLLAALVALNVAFRALS